MKPNWQRLGPWVIGSLALSWGCDLEGETDEDSEVGESMAESGESGPASGSSSSDSMSEDDMGNQPGDAATAQLRVIHGSPDAPPVDVYVAGASQPAVANLAYGEASEFLELPTGAYSFEIRGAGAPAESEPVFAFGEIELAQDDRLSALASGRLTSADPEDTFRIVPLFEDFAEPTAGQALVRVVHVGSDAPTVGIDVGNDGSIELDGLSRFSDTGTPGIGLPAGENLQLGITAGGQNVTSFTTPQLPEDGELLVIATGLLSDLPRDDSGFSLLAVTPEGALGFIRQNPTVYAFHASPDAPVVDVCVGGAPLIEELGYGELSPVTVPPGAYTLDFFGSPSDCEGIPATSQPTPPLEAGERYLAIATGELTPEGEDPGFELVPLVEAFSLDQPTRGVFDVVHAASAPAVDIGLIRYGYIFANRKLYRDLAWPELGEIEYALEPGTYPIGVTAANRRWISRPLAGFDVSIGASFRGWVVATGALAPDGDEAPFGLVAIDTSTPQWSVTPLPVR